MTVGIQHEGAVIVGVILRPKSGRAVVAPSRQLLQRAAGRRSRRCPWTRRPVSLGRDPCISLTSLPKSRLSFSMSVRDSHGNGKDGHAEDQSKDGYVEDHRRCRFVKGSPGLVGACSSSWRMAPRVKRHGSLAHLSTGWMSCFGARHL